MAIPNLSSHATLTPVPFKVFVPEEEVQKLNQLLDLTPSHLPTYENSQSSHHGKKEGDKYMGLTREWMEGARQRWRNGFSWREQEKKINEFPQYTVTIPSGSRVGLPDGFQHAPSNDFPDFKLHFLAHISPSPKSIPILLLHGWPGSFLEFLKVFEILKKSTELEFSIIAPSNAGYAWSDKPDRELSLHDQAYLADQLMAGLGFGVDSGRGYFTQGGDIGSYISRVLLAHFPSCRGAHFNLLFGKGLKGEPLESWENNFGNEPREREMIRRGMEFVKSGRGYGLEHGTRPSTIGMVIESSPVALLGWIGEKLLEWTDPTQPPLPLDEILTLCSVWWFTKTFPTSIYFYRQPRNLPMMDSDKKIGFGLSNFPFELFPSSRKHAENEGKLIFYRSHDKGGHFAAMENPEALCEDIKTYVNLVLLGEEEKK